MSNENVSKASSRSRGGRRRRKLKYGWQLELPLGPAGKISRNDIICGIDPATKEPEYAVHYLVKKVTYDGQVVAIRLGVAEEEIRVFENQREVYKIASVFRSRS